MPKLDGSGVIVKLGLAGWFASSKEDSPDSPFDSASDPPIVIGIGWCGAAVVGVADAVVAAADAVGVEGEKEEAAGEKEAAEDENLGSPTLSFPSADGFGRRGAMNELCCVRRCIRRLAEQDKRELGGEGARWARARTGKDAGQGGKWERCGRVGIGKRRPYSRSGMPRIRPALGFVPCLGSFLSRAHVNHAPVASAFLNALLSLSSIRPPTGGSGSSPVAALAVGPPFTEAMS